MQNQSTEARGKFVDALLLFHAAKERGEDDFYLAVARYKVDHARLALKRQMDREEKRGAAA